MSVASVPPPHQYACPPTPPSPGPSSSPLLAPHRWTYDPAFGIVHISGCRVCLHYRRHLASASASAATRYPHDPHDVGIDTDLSLRSALIERDSQQNAHILRGVDEGMRLQRELDESPRRVLSESGPGLFERYLEAKELAKEKTDQLVKAKKELRQVKAQFEALRVLFDEMADFNSLWGSADYDDDVGGPVGEGLFSGCEGSCRSDSVGDEKETDSLDSVAVPFQLPSPPETPEGPTAASLPPTEYVDNDALDETLMRPATDEVLAPPPPSDDDDERLHQDDLVCDDSASSLEEVATLLDEARNLENIHALTRVRALCTLAQRTPRGERTKIQEYVLHHWRGPIAHPAPTPITFPPSPLPSPSPPPSPLPAHTEFFVDASAWGIGFVLNGRWLSWKLKPGWNEKLSGRDINWSEMVAVELGLRVLAHAGFRASLTVRSDNAGVVQALVTGRSKHEQQAAILRNVLHLANEHAIDLRPVWVSTKDNVADRYSRGEVEPRALVYPKVPPVPAHLVRFVEEAVLSARASH